MYTEGRNRRTTPRANGRRDIGDGRGQLQELREIDLYLWYTSEKCHTQGRLVNKAVQDTEVLS